MIISISICALLLSLGELQYLSIFPCCDIVVLGNRNYNAVKQPVSHNYFILES